MQKTKSVALLGAGWLGEPLGDVLLADNYHVKAATTSNEKALRLASKEFDSYEMIVQSDHIQGKAPSFWAVDTLILTLPPGGRRDPAVATTYPAKVDQIIKAAQAGGISKVLFTSSTGVYGNQQAWVDEESPLQPTTASGKALVQVEQQLRDAFGKQLTVLRLAGLVGGSRQPGRWFAGKTQVPGGEQYVNLVHRVDVVNLCKAILQHNYWGTTLNVCADRHPTKANYYPEAARQLDLVPPSFLVDPKAAPGKRVTNERSKEVPGFRYQYPDPKAFPGF
ncbi:MAG: SDR family oxidoreductase [Bacteroidota bacterium]